MLFQCTGCASNFPYIVKTVELQLPAITPTLSTTTILQGMSARPRCCILLCKAHHQNPNSSSGICFHRFPSNHKLRQKWCTEIQEKAKQTIRPGKYKNARICSRHFRQDDYVVQNDPSKELPSILSRSAIPSIFPLPHSSKRNDELQHTFPSSDSSRIDEEFLMESDDCNGIGYRCQECGFSTQNFHEYSVHTFTHEDPGNTTDELIIDDDDSVSLNLPNKILNTSKVDLPTATSSVEENMEEEVFQCIHCSFWVQSMPEFHEHMLGHSNDELFKCSYCEYRAVNQYSVQQHILSKHPETDAKWILVQEAIPGQYDQFLKRRMLPDSEVNVTVEEEEKVKSDVAMVVEHAAVSMQLDSRSCEVSHYEDPLGYASILGDEAHQIFLVEPSGSKELDENGDDEFSEPEDAHKIQMRQHESEMKEMSGQLNFFLFREKQAVKTCAQLKQNVSSVKLNLESLSKKLKDIEDELREKECEKVDVCNQLSIKLTAKIQTEMTLRLQQSELFNVQISLLQEVSNELQESLTQIEVSVRSSQTLLQEQIVEIKELQQKKQNLTDKIGVMEKLRDDTLQLLTTVSVQMNTIESNIHNCENLNVIRSKIESLRIRQNSTVRSFISLEKRLMKLKYLKMIKKLEEKENHWLSNLKLGGLSNGNPETIESR